MLWPAADAGDAAGPAGRTRPGFRAAPERRAPANRLPPVSFDCGHRFAEAITYGSPDGIVFRLILTGPDAQGALRRDRSERLLPADATVGAMAQRYWADPVATVVT